MLLGAATSAESIVDPSNVRFRLRSITTGVVLSLGGCVACLVYFGLTWERDNRSLMLALTAVAVAGSGALLRLPTERIVRSRWREPFFLAWSTSIVALILVAFALDDGGGSPLALALFLTLIFAAMSYPLPSVLLIGSLEVFGYAVVATAFGQADSTYIAFFSACLGLTALMCAWQARNHERQRKELARVSRADPLTGCLNRRGFEERLEAELSHATRTARPLGLVLVDLDDFKQVNDTRGHAAGDEMLCWAVETMRATVRPSDAIGRLGGDEFAILLPEAGEANALATAARVRDALAERNAVSTGVASFPIDGGGAEELLRRADTALYAHKDGRAVDPGPAHADLTWAAAMAQAVDARMSGHHEHSASVARYAVMIAERLGWSEPGLGQLRLAAMLHDVGLVSLPDAVLLKAGSLTGDEMREMRRHTSVAAGIVARIDGMAPIVPWIRHCHEHWDGSGYPSGLRGEQIPEGARILLVADALDAMTRDRPYRDAMTLAEALVELEYCAGTQFDPRCVELLLDALAQPAGA